MSTPSRPTQPPSDRAASVKLETAASPDLEADESDEDLTLQDADPDSPVDNAAAGGAAANSADSSGDIPNVPVQKRRRVTRACDECRRKKIKCDGKQPCTHCQVYSYDCTYDKPSNRRRNPAPQYIEALENKLSRAENLLRKFMPDVDLNDPNLDPSVQQEFRMREQARQKAAALRKEQSSSPAGLDGQLQSMIETVGQLDLDERGDYDFHGISSGSVFFKRMKEHFRTLLGRDYQVPFMPRPPRPAGVLSLDSPRSASSSPWEPTTAVPDIYDLPSKDRALALCAESLDNATCLLRIVHKPSFYEMLDSLYAKPAEAFLKEDNRNLALAYSAMALGCMYNVPDAEVADTSPYKISIEEALKYYSSARALLQDITECRDLASLQALLFMILFIQSISNLSTCYGFVGIALRSALRMGLHRHLPHPNLNPIEIETRRRVFYLCRQMDTYVSALLGFPLLLNDDDIDQPMPTPVDDQYITKDGILTPPPGTPSFFEAFNAHVKLMEILGRVVKNVYPLKGMDHGGVEGEGPYASYTISYAKIKDMEEELQQWNEQLPVAWRPSPDGPVEVVRVRNLLRFAYAHVQMVLYRPFLHYVSPRISAGKNVNERAYACGAAGISVARNIVHLGTEMRKQVSLVGPYWFTLFSEFFAIISLVFFVLENQDKPGSTEILADAVAGKDMISELAKKSMVADRISGALEMLFEQLPSSLKKVKARNVPSKKRPASGSRTGSLSGSAPQIYPGEAARRQAEIAGRARSSSTKQARAASGAVQQGVSFDGTPLPNPEFGSSFSSGFQYSPLTVPAQSPESLAAASIHEPSHLNLQHRASGAAQQIHRLESMMFPTNDPLAYPNQPRDDFGIQRPGVPGASPGGMPHHDPSQYYLPTNMYDGIEGQLLGPLPPYLMQTQTQPNFPFPTQMYSDPMLPSQQMHHMAPRHQHPQHNGQSQQERQRQAREFGDISANTTWHGMFPPPGMD
ncbi:fungal-specific transcription factor domain-containing protein [Xylariomycetidae sp. FL0641]|nr:fungal-specific transcription factor domain-containing protein [Xylariomycetidae sp. FL0641]